MTAALGVSVLTTNHDRGNFACGAPELDGYLQRRARQDLRRKLAVPYILAESAGRIAGYYTLSNFSIDLADLPGEIAAKLPYPRIPAMLIGRLAVDRGFQGRNIGEFLLMDALRRSAEQGRALGLWAVVVHAKSENAAGFYRNYGFITFAGNLRHLFLPMKTIAALFR